MEPMTYHELTNNNHEPSNPRKLEIARTFYSQNDEDLQALAVYMLMCEFGLELETAVNILLGCQTVCFTNNNELILKEQ